MLIRLPVATVMTRLPVATAMTRLPVATAMTRLPVATAKTAMTRLTVTKMTRAKRINQTMILHLMTYHFPKL
jgi:hypothetical protein